MKKAGFVLIMAGLLVACGNNNTSTRNKIDSIGEKFDSSAEKIWDFTKEEARELKEKIENRLDKRDSAQ